MSRYAFSTEVVSCIELQTADARYLLPAACIEEVLHTPELEELGEPATMAAIVGELVWQNTRIPVLDLERLVLKDQEEANGKMKAIVLKSALSSVAKEPVAIVFYGDIAQLDVDGAAVQEGIPESVHHEWIAMACRYNNQDYLIPALTEIFDSLR